MSKYELAKLRRHTERIRRRHEHLTSLHGKGLRDSLRAFNQFLESLEAEDKTIQRSVRQLISVRFFNHIYSALVLIEAGLFSDATGCERAALEAFAAFQLVSISPEYAETYQSEEFPKPVKVRIILEEKGFGLLAKQIQELYASASGVLHVNRRHERFNVIWEENDNGLLRYGGAESRADHEHMVRWLGTLVSWFLSIESQRAGG